MAEFPPVHRRPDHVIPRSVSPALADRVARALVDVQAATGEPWTDIARAVTHLLGGYLMDRSPPRPGEDLEEYAARR